MWKWAKNQSTSARTKSSTQSYIVGMYGSRTDGQSSMQHRTNVNVWCKRLQIDRKSSSNWQKSWNSTPAGLTFVIQQNHERVLWSCASLRYRSSTSSHSNVTHVVWHYCAVFNWVPRKWLPQTVQLMRSLSVIIVMLVSSSVMGQAYNCGMFGIINDDLGVPYFWRFDVSLDSVKLESAATCNIIHSGIEVTDITRRKRWSKIYIKILHEDFDDAWYIIKYPTGSWNVMKERYATETGSMWVFE